MRVFSISALQSRGEVVMKSFRVLAASLAAASLSLLPGCLTLYSKTEVVRGEEPRRPVTFENVQAAETFYKAVKSNTTSLGGTDVSVPFITLYSKERHLSDSALFNDCVLRCDTNQDGIITLAEAQIFAQLKE
jgi:hypothetical protein